MWDKCVQTNLSRLTAPDKSMDFLLEIVDIKITDIPYQPRSTFNNFRCALLPETIQCPLIS